MNSLRLALAAVAATWVGLAASPARACMNGMRMDEQATSPGEMQIAKAQRLLRKRDFAGAIAEVQRARQELPSDKRIGQVVGLANVGLAETEGRAAKPDAKTVQARAAQAVEALGPVVQADASTYFQAKLGEAEILAGKPEAGLARLEPLEKQGLIPDVPAWLALAQARQAKGDLEGARRAVAKALELDPTDRLAQALQKELASPAKAPAAQAADRS